MIFLHSAKLEMSKTDINNWKTVSNDTLSDLSPSFSIIIKEDRRLGTAYWFMIDNEYTFSAITPFKLELLINAFLTGYIHGMKK